MGAVRAFENSVNLYDVVQFKRNNIRKGYHHEHLIILLLQLFYFDRNTNILLSKISCPPLKAKHKRKSRVILNRVTHMKIGCTFGSISEMCPIVLIVK